MFDMRGGLRRPVIVRRLDEVAELLVVEAVEISLGGQLDRVAGSCAVRCRPRASVGRGDELQGGVLLRPQELGGLGVGDLSSMLRSGAARRRLGATPVGLRAPRCCAAGAARHRPRLAVRPVLMRTAMHDVDVVARLERADQARTGLVEARTRWRARLPCSCGRAVGAGRVAGTRPTGTCWPANSFCCATVPVRRSPLNVCWVRLPGSMSVCGPRACCQQPAALTCCERRARLDVAGGDEDL